MIRESNLAGLVGAKVVDRDGDKIGTVGRIYVDPSTGRANWAAVRTGLFGTSETFLPLQEADEDGENIRVPYEKGFVKDAPRIDDDTELTHEEEDELYAYYDSILPGRAPAETDADAAPAPAREPAPAATYDEPVGTEARSEPVSSDAYAQREPVSSDAYAQREPVSSDASVAPETGGETAAPAAVATPAEERRPRLRKHVLTDDGGETVGRGSVRVDPETETSTR